MDLNGKRIALVLSGGGAKGAYQTGMLRALEEIGLKKENLAIAGTSIGALNALKYAVSDTDGMREMIAALGDTEDSADAFARRFYPDEPLEANTIPVSVCAYCLEREQAEYFHLTGLPAQEQRDLAVASASLPDKLPPVEYKGSHYLDGGKIPPQCSAKAKPADKLPVWIFKEEWETEQKKDPETAAFYDLLIISYLKPEDALDLSWVPESTKIWEFRPSEPLEDVPGSGTRDYSAARLEKNERMGYEETKSFLSRQ